MSATIVSIKHPGFDRRRRRAEVRRALLEVRAWCEAGLEGAVDLEEATHGANRALVPAIREVTRSALS